MRKIGMIPIRDEEEATTHFSLLTLSDALSARDGLHPIRKPNPGAHLSVGLARRVLHAAQLHPLQYLQPAMP
jgi:hypothetical protein